MSIYKGDPTVYVGMYSL